MNDQTKALLNEVQSILAKCDDDNAARVAKAVARLLPELPGFAVAVKFKARFTPKQYGLGGDAGQSKAAAKIANKALTQMMNARRDGDYITQQMTLFASNHKGLLAGEGMSKFSALISRVTEMYAKESQRLSLT